MDYLTRYAFWRDADLPEDIKRELTAIKDDTEE